MLGLIQLVRQRKGERVAVPPQPVPQQAPPPAQYVTHMRSPDHAAPTAAMMPAAHGPAAKAQPAKSVSFKGDKGAAAPSAEAAAPPQHREVSFTSMVRPDLARADVAGGPQQPPSSSPAATTAAGAHASAAANAAPAAPPAAKQEPAPAAPVTPVKAAEAAAAVPSHASAAPPAVPHLVLHPATAGHSTQAAAAAAAARAPGQVKALTDRQIAVLNARATIEHFAPRPAPPKAPGAHPARRLCVWVVSEAAQCAGCGHARGDMVACGWACSCPPMACLCDGTTEMRSPAANTHHAPPPLHLSLPE